MPAFEVLDRVKIHDLAGSPTTQFVQPSTPVESSGTEPSPAFGAGGVPVLALKVRFRMPDMKCMPSCVVPLMTKPQPCGSAVDCAMMSVVMVMLPIGGTSVPWTVGQVVEAVLMQ